MSRFDEPYSISLFLGQYGDCPVINIHENTGEIAVSANHPDVRKNDLREFHEHVENNMEKLVFVRYKRVSSSISYTSYGPAQIISLNRSGENGVITEVSITFMLRNDIPVVPTDLYDKIKQTENDK